MPPLLRSIFDYLFSVPLHSFWLLVAGFILGCYALAAIFFKAIPRRAGTTIVAHARKAWGLAFLVHALICGCVMLPWYFGNRMLAGFGSFFAFYCILLAIDLIVGIGLIVSARRFQSYRQAT